MDGINRTKGPTYKTTDNLPRSGAPRKMGSGRVSLSLSLRRGARPRGRGVVRITLGVVFLTVFIFRNILLFGFAVVFFVFLVDTGGCLFQDLCRARRRRRRAHARRGRIPPRRRPRLLILLLLPDNISSLSTAGLQWPRDWDEARERTRRVVGPVCSFGPFSLPLRTQGPCPECGGCQFWGRTFD